MNAKILKTIMLILLLFCLCLQSNASLALPSVQRTVLPNRLILLVCEEHSLPFVTLQLLIPSGSSKDPSGEEGLSYLTAKGLLLGTSKRNATAIYEELDFIGASLRSSPGRDYATLNLKVMKKDLEKGFDLFMEVLTQPTFPEDEIKREVEKTLAAIQSAEDDPGEVAEKEFQKALFLESPYAHPVEGTRESLPRITRKAIHQFFRTYYHPNNSIFTIVGDITPDEVRKKLLPRLIQWPMVEVPERPFQLTFAKGPKTVTINRNITQANLILGHQGVSRGNPDYYALIVMNHILGGGGFSSRLVEEIRVKRGLAYSVGSFFDVGKFPGSFQIVIQTKNESAREAITLSLQEMERIRKEPVLEKDLERTKKYLVGSFPMRIDTQAKLANFFTQVEFYGIGHDYPKKYSTLIHSVTREDILRVAQKYLQPKNTILVVVANLKEAGME
mgnify:CR=1 FL=1